MVHAVCLCLRFFFIFPSKRCIIFVASGAAPAARMIRETKLFCSTLKMPADILVFHISFFFLWGSDSVFVNLFDKLKVSFS